MMIGIGVARRRTERTLARVFGNRCPRQYENGNRRDSGEDGSPKENPEVLGSLIQLSNLFKGDVFPILRFEHRNRFSRLDDG